MVVDFDDGSIEFDKSFIETVHALSDTLEQQRLPLLLFRSCTRAKSTESEVVSIRIAPNKGYWIVVVLTCGFSMMLSDVCVCVFQDDGRV